MYSAKILCDSLSPDHVRLTTFEVVFPRFLLAEFNTHRAFSRNSASSRAIPTEKLIEQVKTNPFIPEFNKRVKGMGVGEPLSQEEQAVAKNNWRIARDAAVKAAESMLDIDKSRVNRLLEPFMWHTALVTATEWSNFWALRTAPTAQPEFQKIANMMLDAYEANSPYTLEQGMWHLPLIQFDEYRQALFNPTYWKKVSVGRCARVSYMTHDGVKDPDKDVYLHDQLLSNGHMSPFEHQARPTKKGLWSGNFFGWHQYRKDIPNESDFSRVLELAAA